MVDVVLFTIFISVIIVFIPSWVLGRKSASKELKHLRRVIEGYQKECGEVEQALGQALGYPWFKDDQKNFPGTTEKDGVCIADHTPGTLAQETKVKLDKLNSLAKKVADLSDGESAVEILFKYTTLGYLEKFEFDFFQTVDSLACIAQKIIGKK